ncbi:Callose synthase 10-like protein [Drosera capensis]
MKIDEKAITEVFKKVLDNYIKWCTYLRIRLVWNSLEAIDRERKLFLVSLYFLIWGEAANVRFLPECICYIFHQMAKELDAILDHGEAEHAASCRSEDGSVSFLDQIIRPIYQVIAVEAANNNGGKAAHSAWRNYDDFNEYFWSPSCFELQWPMRKESPFLRKPKKWKRTAKSSFVEHRTFLHLYRSFHRLWIFLIVMFQVLTIIGFTGAPTNLDRFKIMLSIGPTFAIMNFIECCLDVLLMFGAYTTARGMAISRLVIRFLWWGVGSGFATYVYLKVLDERKKNSSDQFYFHIYIIVLGAYAALRVVFALLLKLPCSHALSRLSDHPFFQFFKWIYQERYFVGRGLFERPTDYIRLGLWSSLQELSSIFQNCNTHGMI